MNKIRIGVGDRFVRKVCFSLIDSYEKHFNTPVKFIDNDWYVNERIVEIPFVLRHIQGSGNHNRILELGCTRSDLALQMASQGHQVIGVDLRDYEFTHPNLRFHKGDLLEFEDNEEFDIAIAISVLEHVGLGAYGEKPNNDALVSVINKMTGIVKAGGRLIVTVPIGQPHQDTFLRSFAYDEFVQLFSSNGLTLHEEQLFSRSNARYWRPSNPEKVATISNAANHRGPTGVNSVGCFVWYKQ